MKENRIFSFIIILITYIIASIIGVLVSNLELVDNLYINILIADVCATSFVYLVGLVLKNASVYDPYWSVAPLVILPLVINYTNRMNLGIILLLIAIFYWGIRLTLNWAYTFKSIKYQDWRYTMISQKSGKLFPIASFFGINLMPTLIVYFALLPALYFIVNLDFSYFSLIGFIICIIATTIQLISDIQLHVFKKHRKSKQEIINVGLWKYSRHPNYFGEVLIWWGVFVFCFGSDINSWYLFFGALLNTLLFLFISIPMQEKNLISKKEDYQQYINNTWMLIPWFKKK